jgi:hypothetical protein
MQCDRLEVEASTQIYRCDDVLEGGYDARRIVSRVWSRGRRGNAVDLVWLCILVRGRWSELSVIARVAQRAWGNEL